MGKLEVACGAVVYTWVNDEIKYVVIHSLNGDYGFPKGHKKDLETEVETALREIKEEVGVDVTIVYGFREIIEYTVKKHIPKQSIYYLATYQGQELVRQEDEVESIELLNYEEAYARLTYKSNKELLNKANEYIKNNVN